MYRRLSKLYKTVSCLRAYRRVWPVGPGRFKMGPIVKKKQPKYRPTNNPTRRRAVVHLQMQMLPLFFRNKRAKSSFSSKEGRPIMHSQFS